MLTGKELLSYALQLANGLFPLAVIPIISRENGEEGLATFFILLSISGIVQIVCDYGFNISAIRDGTHNPDSSSVGEYLRELLVGAVFVKLIIALVVISTAFVFVGHLSNYLKIQNDYIFALIVMSTLISILNQSWYLYTIKKTHTYSAILFILKLGAIFFLIIYGFSTWALLVIILVPNLLSNGYSSLKCWRDISHYNSNTSIANLILDGFQKGGAVFLNTLAASGIAASWPLFIGLTATAMEVSLFGLADKIVRGFMMFVTPLPSFILAKKQLTSILHLGYRYYLIGIILLGLLPASLILFLPPGILTFILGDKFTLNQNILSILIFVLPFVIANAIFYTQFLLKRKELYFSVIIPISAFLAISLIYLIELKTLFAPLLTEIIVLFIFIIASVRKRI